MADTPNLTLPYLAAAQAQKHVTVNEALRRLDALVQLAVISRTLAVPPGNPADGARYLVPAAASGVFSGQANAVAAFQDGAWAFIAPEPGWRAFIVDEARLAIWDGTIWNDGIVGGLPGSVPQLGINASADAGNRLTVSSAATLFNHAGAGHQMKLNKANAGATASLLYQTGFSGRAEMGLAGDDDFRIKVTVNGDLWNDALRIDAATGAIALPGSPALGGVNLLLNGDFRINQRGFAGGALAAGLYGHDRWKADAGGATYTVANGIVALASGAVIQVLDPIHWQAESFAGSTLTLSLEDLTGGNLAVGIGAQNATLAPASGRIGARLTLGVGESGPIAVRLAPVSAAVSFRRVKIERGPLATAFVPRPRAQEEAECARYFRRLSDHRMLVGDDAANSRNPAPLAFVPMRATPAVVIASGGLTGQHALAPTLIEGPFADTLVVGFGASAYRAGFRGTGFVTLDLSAEL